MTKHISKVMIKFRKLLPHGKIIRLQVLQPSDQFIIDSKLWFQHNLFNATKVIIALFAVFTSQMHFYHDHRFELSINSRCFKSTTVSAK